MSACVAGEQPEALPLTCPVCGEETEVAPPAPTHAAAPGQSEKFRLDLRGVIADDGPDGKFPPLPQCRQCRFVFDKDNARFFTTKKSIETLAKYFNSTEFLSISWDAPTYFILGRMGEKLNLSKALLANYYLMSSWEAENKDGDDPERKVFIHIGLKESLKHTNAYLESSTWGAEDPIAVYLLIELNRRMGNFSAAMENTTRFRDRMDNQIGRIRVGFPIEAMADYQDDLIKVNDGSIQFYTKIRQENPFLE